MSDAWQRVQEKTGRDLRPELEEIIASTSDSDLCLAQFARWLEANSNPSVRADQIAAHPHAAEPLLRVLGFSGRMGDTVIQNPEFADLVLDPDFYHRDYDQASEQNRLVRMLESAHSYAHKLDRLRLFKQQWTFWLSAHELMEDMPAPRIWRVISDVAATVVRVAREVVWAKYAADRDVQGPCPVSIVAFGKLGGNELNYSSDIDLAYVLADDCESDVDATRFCEAFGRALSDAMGRGWLYRVDLRLRPYGGTGPIVNRVRAVESYYRLYAEPWEHLALIRSKVIAGDAELVERWRAMREEVCFARHRGEWVFEEIASLRERTERIAKGDDLKRGPGGIRDVEFLTQMLQLLYGPDRTELRGMETLDSLRSLRDLGLLPEADTLATGYEWLRRTEHRLQIAQDRQTHSVPTEGHARHTLARSLGRETWADLELELARQRDAIRTTYRRWIRVATTDDDRRAAVLDRLISGRENLERWFDSMPESGEYYRSLFENEQSLARAATLAQRAPVLIDLLSRDRTLTEAVLTGEIEEPDGVRSEGTRRYLVAAVRAILGQDASVGRALAEASEAIAREWAPAGLYVFTLGSCAADELVWGGDLDVLLAVDQEGGEMASEFVRRAEASRGSTLPVKVDLRLRPEGRFGSLARSLAAFEAYAQTDMEPWERMAIMRSRWVSGPSDQLHWLRSLALSTKLTPEIVVELQHIKRRVESERVGPVLMNRQIKLGRGGLMDIQWLCSLLLWKCELSDVPARTMDRLTALGNIRELNMLEVEPLKTGLRHHLRVRESLSLLGWPSDLIPENPDKLSQLATLLGYVDGNAFLDADSKIRHAVRALYEDTVARLHP